MSVRELLLDMRVRLLTGPDGADAIRVAAVLAEAALKHLIGADPRSGHGLGEMIGEAHKTPELKERLGRELLSELAWLNERRISSVHFKGAVEMPTLDDAKRVVDAATELVRRAGLAEDAEIERLEREAEWKASSPATTSILKLDRKHQRAELDDLLGLRRRVLALVVDGEVGQGHDHFGDVIHWRLRAIPKGQWQIASIDWPAPSASAGVRFATLIEALAAAVGARVTLPDDDPLGDGEAAWDEAIAAVLARVARLRRRLCVRHKVGWLDDSDPELVKTYLGRVWHHAVDRGCERTVLAFELVRAQGGGMPFSKAWRVSRRERKVAARVAEELENMTLPRECRSAALDELTSVSEDDLVDWFRNEQGEGKSAAHASAQKVLDATSGGRFELVVKRLAPLSGRSPT